MPLRESSIESKQRDYRLLDVVHPTEDATPAHATHTFAVGIARPPYKDRFAHDVVFRHEAPVTRVG